MKLIFVYGTLKRGYPLNSFLVERGAAFVGEATTIDRFNLIDAGVPVIMRNATTGARVKGEVWRIPDDILPRLDRIEAAYTRQLIKVNIGEGESDAYTYEGRKDTWEKVKNRKIAPVNGVVEWRRT